MSKTLMTSINENKMGMLPLYRNNLNSNTEGWYYTSGREVEIHESKTMAFLAN